MARNPQIVVEYVAKTTDLNAAAAQVGSASSKAGAAAKKAFVPAVAALGAFGVASRKAVDAASGLNEQISASEVVFGKHAKSMQAWGKTGAEAFGLSQKEALAAANAYGNMFNTVGLGEKEVAGMSKSMVQLAGDMASFHDQDPTAMLDALRSGLSGEAEPLKRFGVLMTEATVKAAAYKNGIAAAGSELTEGQKVQARYALIMEQTGKAQGDFARTSGSVANQQRILKAETENTTATFGQALLPAMAALQKIASSLIGLFNGNQTALTAFIAIVVGGAAAVVAINAAMTAWTAITAAHAVVTKILNADLAIMNVLMRALPVVAIVTAVLALGAALIYAYKHSETFRDIVNGAFNAIKKVAEAVFGVLKSLAQVTFGAMASAFGKVQDAASAVFGWFKKNWPLLLAILIGPIGLATKGIIDNWDKIKAGAGSAVETIKRIWGGLKDFLQGVASGIASVALNIFKGPINAVIDAWNRLRIPGFSINIKIPGPIPDIKFAWGGLDLPDIPKLAKGGIVTAPTLAMIGESGPEAVVPLSGGGRGGIEVRVFIGDTELKGLVRTEIVDADTRTARTLLAGAGG